MELLDQQTSKWFTKNINKYGCYFMSILFCACNHVNKRLSPSKVMCIYEDAVNEDYMTFSCYIKNPAKVGTLALKYLGHEDLRFRYVGSERDGKLDFYNEDLAEKINATIDNIKIMLELHNGNVHYGGHFVTEGYNPDRRLIPTGEQLGKRYFYIGEK